MAAKRAMRMHRLLRFGLAASVVVALTFGLFWLIKGRFILAPGPTGGSTGEPSSSSASGRLSAAERAPSQPTGRLVVLLQRPVITLDPLLAVTTESVHLVSHLYEGLVRFDSMLGQVQPHLVSAWRTVGKSYEMDLRPGVRFHDGSILTTGDVVASFKRTLASPVGRAMLWDVESVGPAESSPNRVVIRLSATSASFLMRLALVSAYVTKPAEPYLLGTGPYRMSWWNKAVGAVELKPHQAHWSASPRLESVVFRSEPDLEVAARP